MKITSVELRPAGSTEVIELSFRDPASRNPYQVKAIQGLDADEITSRYYGTGGSGDRFYSPTLVKRVPVFLMGLNPRFSGDDDENSYSALRDRLYRSINSSRTGIIEIRFLNGDAPVASIFGRVSKFEAGLFTEKPEVKITFGCDYPMLQSLARTTFGPYSGNDILVADGLSTAQHGFQADILVTADTEEISVMGDTDDWWFKIIHPFEAGDTLHISSESWNKELYLTRSGGITHLADKIKQGSIWPLIFPGDNRLRCPFYPVVWDSVAHYQTYWGI